MAAPIGILTVHPLPEPDESVGKWIEKLAIANKVNFGAMFIHISRYAKTSGLLEALSGLTGVSKDRVSSLDNEFRSEFWKNPIQCPISDCEDTSKYPSGVFIHLGNKHNLVVLQDCPHCEEHKAKTKGALKDHLKYVHGIETDWEQCPQPNCPHVAKSKRDLKQHLENVHGIGGKELLCPQTNCDYKTKRMGTLNRHIAREHGIGLKSCFQPDCDYKAKDQYDLKTHLARAHKIGIKCSQPDCDYIAATNAMLNIHLTHEHNINVEWHPCPEPDCNFKAKSKGNLEQHLASEHDIGVQWHPCPKPDCNYKAKSGSKLRRHLKRRDHSRWRNTPQKRSPSSLLRWMDNLD